MRLCAYEPMSLLNLPVHQIRFIHVDRVAVMKQRDENGQADGGFRGGDGHDEEDEDESVHLMKLPRVGEEGEVDGVHHELDGHEDGDAVLARQDADHADREQDRAEDQKVMCRDHGAASLFLYCRLLRRSATTIAASS